MKNLAATVILYNPQPSVIENIKSYITQVDILIAVDNSERKIADDILEFFESNDVIYIRNGKNLGIAAALNQAANLAIKEGFDFLLTMDQDSSATEKMIEALFKYVKENKDAGVISPVHLNKFGTTKIEDEEIVPRLCVKTSGNILNLKIFKKIGPFWEDLFIDYVDIEYCMRLNNSGYKVLEISKAELEHNEADIIKKKFFNKIVYPYNHSPIRYYYKTRNRLYLRKKYKNIFPEYFDYEIKLFINNLIKTVIYEDKKLMKLKMTALGLWDYFRGQRGAIGRDSK